MFLWSAAHRNFCLAVVASIAVLMMVTGGRIWWNHVTSDMRRSSATFASEGPGALRWRNSLCNSAVYRGRLCRIEEGSTVSFPSSSSSSRSSFSVGQRSLPFFSSFTKDKPLLFLKDANSFPSITNSEAFLQSCERENAAAPSSKSLSFKDLYSLMDLCSSKLDAVSCLAYLKENKTEYLREVVRRHQATLHDSLDQQEQQTRPEILPRSTLQGRKMIKAHRHEKKRRSCIDNNIHSMKNLIHVFWKGAITRHALLCVKSFLYTQRLDRTRLVLWHMDEETLLHGAVNNSSAMGDGAVQSLQRILRTYHDSIELRIFDAKREIQYLDSLLICHGKKPTNLSESFAEDKNPVTNSDVFRFLVLTLYGGIYLDADTLLLRDLGPLFEIEFAYRWTYQKGLNTAVLGLKKHSEYGMRMHSENNGDYFPLRILPGLIDLPTAFFDPLWIMLDTIDRPANVSQALPDLLKGTNVEETGFSCMFTCEVNDQAMASLFAGAFAYHWHNEWNITWSPNSYLGWQERHIDAFLETKLL